ASPPVLANGSTSGDMNRMRNRRGMPSLAPSPYPLPLGGGERNKDSLSLGEGESRGEGGAVFTHHPPSDLLEDGIDERGHMRRDPLEVGQHVEVDLRCFQRLREALAKAHEMRFPHLALALTYGRPLVQHVLGQAAVAGGEARDGALEIFRHESVKLDQLG